jgi:predicted nucleic acid-binding protein
VRLVLDTNRYTELCRGDPQVAGLVERAELVFLPFVVLAELRVGFAIGSRGSENEKILQRFLSKPGVDVLFPSDTTTRVYAGLYRQLRSQGTAIPTNDLWIASIVVEHDLTLSSGDEHFRHLPQLILV